MRASIRPVTAPPGSPSSEPLRLPGLPGKFETVMSLSYLSLLPGFVRLIPPRHGDPWQLQPPLWTSWRIDPTVLIGVFALAAAYILLTGPLNDRRVDAAARSVTRKQRISFLAGCVVLLLALGPPLEDWSGLLMSGHMTQHLLLIFAVPPLILYGTPAWLLEPLLRWPVVARAGYLLTRPVTAFALSSAVILIWHLPVVYEAALQFTPLHILQHQLFLLTAILVWWPLLGPLPEWPRSSPLIQIALLIALTFPGAIVGSFLTLGQPGFYPTYTTVPRMWGIALATDQQAAGLLMWVGGGIIYLLLVTIVFFQWAAAAETHGPEDARPAPDPLPGIGDAVSGAATRE